MISTVIYDFSSYQAPVATASSGSKDQISSFFSASLDKQLKSKFDAIITPLSFHLVDLLPPLVIVKVKEAKSPLEKYQGLITLVRNALDSFDRQEWKLFDPLVGENACQIRAAILLEVMGNKNTRKDVEELRSHLTAIETKIAHFKTSGSKSGVLMPGPFQDLIKKLHGSIPISETLFFLISSYILSVIKYVHWVPGMFNSVERKEKSIPKYLTYHANLSSHFATDFIDHMQFALSRFSVLYVQRIAAQNLIKDETNRLVFGKHVLEDPLRRLMTPFYASIRLALNRLLQTDNRYFVLRVEYFTEGHSMPKGIIDLIYKTKDQTIKLCKKLPSGSTFKQGAMFVYTKSIVNSSDTISSIKERLEKIGFMAIILGNCAAHPQYGMYHINPIGDLCLIDRINSYVNGTCKTEPFALIEHIMAGNKKQFLSNRIIRDLLEITPTTKMSELYNRISHLSGIPLSRLKLRREKQILENSDLPASQILCCSDGVKAIATNDEPSLPLIPHHYFRVLTYPTLNQFLL